MPVLRVRNLLFLASGLVPLHEPGADEDDVARFEGYALLFGALFDFCNSDGVAGCGGVGDVVSFSVRHIIDQDPTANNTPAFGPMMRTVLENVFWFGNLVVWEIVIVKTCLLVSPMAESIPLRAALRIDVQEVVPGEETERLEVFKGVLAFLAEETWFFDVVHSPAMVALSTICSRRILGKAYFKAMLLPVLISF